MLSGLDSRWNFNNKPELVDFSVKSIIMGGAQSNVGVGGLEMVTSHGDGDGPSWSFSLFYFISFISDFFEEIADEVIDTTHLRD